MRLRILDEAAHRCQIDRGSFGFYIDPASLAAQVAGVDDRDVEERRKVLPLPKPALEPLHRQHSFHAEVPEKLTEATRISAGKDAGGKLREHAGTKLAQGLSLGQGLLFRVSPGAPRRATPGTDTLREGVAEICTRLFGIGGQLGDDIGMLLSNVRGL